MASSHPDGFGENVNPEGQDNVALPGNDEVPPAAAGRRDENSISFRHFLQPQTDVVASRHHNSSSSRGVSAGAVDLVDVTVGLPDFVQDHLVLEAESGAEAPLDLSVLHHVLPEFNTSQRNCIRRRAEEERNAHSANSPSQSQSTTLPDFLSDGPMYCTTNNEANSNPSCLQSGNPENRSDMNLRSLSVDGDSQSQLIERLKRELADKTRSITQLQNEVARQRSEIDVLNKALSQAESRSRNNHPTVDMGSGMHGGGDGDGPSHSHSFHPRVNGRVTSDADHNHGRGNGKSNSIVTSLEAIARDLMEQIDALKGEATEPDLENQDHGKDN